MGQFPTLEQQLRIGMDEAVFRTRLAVLFDAPGLAVRFPRLDNAREMLERCAKPEQIGTIMAAVGRDDVLGAYMPKDAAQLPLDAATEAIAARIRAGVNAAGLAPIRAHAPTGERVVMREPGYKRNPLLRAHWQVLAETIARAGAEVIIVPREATKQGSRDCMYTRDPFVKGARGFYNTDVTQPHIAQERAALMQEGAVVPQGVLQGMLEGGEVVPFTPRAQPGQAAALPRLFVGVSHHDALRLRRIVQEQKEAGTMDFQRAKHSKARLVMDAAKSLHEVDGSRVVPLSIRDAEAGVFYHLDGALGTLPSGQAVVAMELFNRASQERIMQEVGRENLIRISQDDALKGATNFITVGKHIITPYAPDALKERFSALGYRVIDPPSVGLPEGAWMFNTMAAVRCATLKVTEDKGFPLVQGQGIAR